MWSKSIGEEDRILFRIGLGLGAAVMLLFLVRLLFPSLELPHWDTPCPVYALSGFYCPGCGGQRAVKALLRLKIAESLRCHPLVLPLFLYYLLYMGSHAANRLSRGRTAALKFKNWHLYFFLVLLLLQWIVKNVLLAAGRYSI